MCIYPGKLLMYNVTQEHMREGIFLSCGQDVSFELVFDTDTRGISRLMENLELMRGLRNCREVICIPQVRNLEEELKYACNLRDVCVLTKSQSVSDFKRDFLRLRDVAEVLIANGFDIGRMWSRNAAGEYAGIMNEAHKIKKL